MEAKAHNFKSEVDYRAYKSALDAGNFARMNLHTLNEGLGLLSNFLEEKREETAIENASSQRYVHNIMPQYAERAQAGAKAVTSNLLSYLSEAESRFQNVYGGGQEVEQQ